MPPPPPASPASDYVDLEVEERLLTTSEDIRQALRVLAETRNAQALSEVGGETKRQVEFQSAAAPQGLDVPLTLSNWRGGIEAALTMVAQATGYGLRKYGTPPLQEIIVFIDGDRRTAYDLLRDIGAQAGVAADVCVAPGGKSISLVYEGGCRSLVSGPMMEPQL